MRIPLPWPAPERGKAFPQEASYHILGQEIISEPIEENRLWIIDLFTVEGLFVADWEVRLWDWRYRHADALVILQVTALPPALIFPDSWGIAAYLVHGATWERLHGFPLPPAASDPPYRPQEGWHLIRPDYEPPLTAFPALNTFLQKLQTWRRTLSAYRPEESSLFYTVADGIYTHFSQSELDSYVAPLRR